MRQNSTDYRQVYLSSFARDQRLEREARSAWKRTIALGTLIGLAGYAVGFFI